MAPINITKKRLERIYNSMTLQEAALALSISHPTLIKMVRQAGLILKGKGNRTHRTKYRIV